MQSLAVRCLAPVLFAAAALPQGGQPNGDTRYWSSWRGPLGSGSAPSQNPPTEWAEATDEGPAKNIAWKVEVPGHGSSTPIVWRDRIYLTTAIETERTSQSTALAPHDTRSLAPPTVEWQFVVLAMNREDGSLAWSTTVAETVPHEGGHATNSHASGSPVTDGEHVYASFGSRGLYCLDLAGKVVWSKDFGLMLTRRQYGEASTPVLYGDVLILKWDHEGDSFLVTLDKRTGDELWRQPRPEQSSWSTPIVVEVSGRPQIIVNATTASRGYDLESGEVIWSLSGMTENTIPIPLHSNGVVYLMSGYRGQMLQAVQLEGAKGDLEGGDRVLWKHLRNTSYVPSGGIYNGRFYFLRGNNGVLSCLDPKTGAVIYEGQRLGGLRSVYASPVYANGRIYITSRDGVTMVIREGRSFEQLAINRLDDDIDGSMAIVDDKIYLRGRRHVYCIAELTEPREPAPRDRGTPMR